jgi:hypothetical protein
LKGSVTTVPVCRYTGPAALGTELEEFSGQFVESGGDDVRAEGWE